MADEGVREERAFAEKLDHLFKTVRDSDQKEYSHEDVAQAIRRQGGPTISATYVWQLRKGLRDNPTKHHIEALCGFFGVPPAYFFSGEAEEKINQELELLVALRDGKIRQAAVRMTGLSKSAQSNIVEMIDSVRKLEGLPEHKDEPQ